jgi:FKBP-type peptidyl-prolyl cis-trans isomerase
MKISFAKKVAVLSTGVVLAFSACKNSPYPGYDTAENGLYYQFYKQDESAVKPKEGDIVRLVMSYKNSKDSVLFDSKVGNPSGTNFIEFPLQKSTFQGSFEDAVSMMGVGDSASFIISADSVYLTTFKATALPPYIEKGSMLTFNAKLEKITSKAEADAERNKQMEEQKAMMAMRQNEEPKILAKYLEDKKISAKPTASGLYYIETVKGKGAKPKKGQWVKVNYTGRLMDGTVFDSSEGKKPIDFPIGEGSVIPGWDEGIMMMNVGSKGKLILPSSIAYGPQGGGPIPPFSPLDFDVELVSVSDTAPPEAGAAGGH